LHGHLDQKDPVNCGVVHRAKGRIHKHDEIRQVKVDVEIRLHLGLEQIKIGQKVGQVVPLDPEPKVCDLIVAVEWVLVS
jgi:hypothetical protein